MTPDTLTADAVEPVADPASREFVEKAAQLRSLVEDLARGAPEAAKEQIAGMRRNLAALCEEGTECAAGAAHRVADTVRSHPIQVTVAAVGAGLLTWWLLSRRA